MSKQPIYYFELRDGLGKATIPLPSGKTAFFYAGSPVLNPITDVRDIGFCHNHGDLVEVIEVEKNRWMPAEEGKRLLARRRRNARQKAAKDPEVSDPAPKTEKPKNGVLAKMNKKRTPKSAKKK